MVTEEMLRTYLRLPPDNTEDLSIFLSAAQARARAAGIPELENNGQYDLYILQEATQAYETRGWGDSGSYQATAEENERKRRNSFVLELRYAEEGE